MPNTFTLSSYLRTRTELLLTSAARRFTEHLLIVGGSDAVINAAFSARERDASADGTAVVAQGRLAGENAGGGNRNNAGAFRSQSVKVSDLAVACTGLVEQEARDCGFDPPTVPTQANDHKTCYPGAMPLHIRTTGDLPLGRLLGEQIVGKRKAKISKRIDSVARHSFRRRWHRCPR